MDGSSFKVEGFYNPNENAYVDHGLDELMDQRMQDIMDEDYYSPMLSIVSSGLRLTEERWINNNGTQLKIQFKDE